MSLRSLSEELRENDACDRRRECFERFAAAQARRGLPEPDYDTFTMGWKAAQGRLWNQDRPEPEARAA